LADVHGVDSARAEQRDDDVAVCAGVAAGRPLDTCCGERPPLDFIVQRIYAIIYERMSPRPYDMSRRSAARAQTRRRIVEATAKLHGEHGVLGTSWRDIAQEADVSIATVYAHFPTLDELLPACGQLVMERARPPKASDAPALIGPGGTREERLRRAADELFGFYQRGGKHLEVDVRERQLPGMREWEEHLRRVVLGFVREALGQGVDARTAKLAAALFDHGTWKAFSTRGVSTRAAAEAAAMMADALVESRTGRTR